MEEVWGDTWGELVGYGVLTSYAARSTASWVLVRTGRVAWRIGTIRRGPYARSIGRSDDRSVQVVLVIALTRRSSATICTIACHCCNRGLL